MVPDDVVDDDPVRARKLVEQRGLADVRTSDDRDPARTADLGVRHLRRLRQRLEDGVEEVARAAAVNGRDRMRLPQPEVPERVGQCLGALVVDLVGSKYDGLAGLAEDLHHGLVVVGDADRRVDHEQHRVGERDRHFGLSTDSLGHAAGIGIPATGVDHGERPAVPVRVVRHSVAGDAGAVLDDRLAPPDDPVDQGRLAHVGPADHGQDGYRADGRVGVVGVVGDVSHRGSP